jgi:uncharacterized membrane protein YdbT with pleckstrin-like domain
VEVVADAVFCHTCGARLAAETAGPAANGAAANGGPNAAASPGEQFQQAAAARQQAANEPEQELWQGGYSPKAMIGAWLATVAGTIAALLLGALWVRHGWIWLAIGAAILVAWLYQVGLLFFRRLNVRYVLGTQKFIHETGILRRITDRIEVLDMDDVSFEQGLLERLVGVGTIRIASSDKSHPQLVLCGIENVQSVAALFDDTRRAERRRRGLHIEQI